MRLDSISDAILATIAVGTATIADASAWAQAEA